MINDKAYKVIEKIFQSFLNRHQIGLETSMRDGNFIFDCAHLLHYKYHRISFKQGGSYIDSLDRMKHKKEIINCLNKKDKKCFEYAVIIALNHEKIKKLAKNSKS